MLLSLDSWVLDVDIISTNAYSSRILEDHCQCGYCRNFYQTVDAKYPSIRPFLKQFGADVEAPDELMPYEPVVLDAAYMVCGRIVRTGNAPLRIHDLTVTPLTVEQLDFETECPSPCFALSVTRFQVPWVLAENMDDVISPANEPEYLQRMWTKLLQEQEHQDIYS